MGEVVVAAGVRQRMEDLENYLVDNFKLSEHAALKRSGRMRVFIHSLGSRVRHQLCRFREWRELGYRCVVFEKSWIIAYQEFEDGVIIQDICHTTLMKE